MSRRFLTVGLVLVLVAALGISLIVTRSHRSPSTFVFSKAVVWQSDAITASDGGNFDTSNPEIVAAITKDAADMQRAGVKWNRWWVAPPYTVDQVSTVVKIFQQHGITMELDVNSGHDSDAATETELKAWLAALVPEMVALGQHHWEIGNEPNIDYRAGGYWDTCVAGVTPSYTKGQGDVVRSVDSYLVRLKDAYTTIHKYDPKALVASAGLSYAKSYNEFCEIPSDQWITQLMKTDAWKYMDYFGIHPYADSAKGVIAALADTRQVMQANSNYAQKTFAITEIGFQQTPHLNEKGRALLYVSVMDALKAYGISTPIFWYDWYDYNNPNGYGLVQYNGLNSRSYLPIYSAMDQYKP